MKVLYQTKKEGVSLLYLDGEQRTLEGDSLAGSSA